MRTAMESPVPTVAVHANGKVEDPTEPIWIEVLSDLHAPDDAGEGQELQVLAAQ